MLTKSEEEEFLMTGIVALDFIKSKEPKPIVADYFGGGMAVAIGFLNEHPKVEPNDLFELAKARFS